MLSPLLVNQALGEQAGKELYAVAQVLVFGEVIVFRPGRPDAQGVHDCLLAGIDAQGVKPALADVAALDNDIGFLGRSRIGDALTAPSLDGEHLAVHSCPTGLIDLLRVVTAAVNERGGDFQL